MQNSPYGWQTEGVELDCRSRAGELVVFEGSTQTALAILKFYFYCKPRNGLEIKVNLIESRQGDSFLLRDFYDVNIHTVIWMIDSNQFGKVGILRVWTSLLEFESDTFDNIFHVYQ